MSENISLSLVEISCRNRGDVNDDRTIYAAELSNFVSKHPNLISFRIDDLDSACIESMGDTLKSPCSLKRFTGECIGPITNSALMVLLLNDRCMEEIYLDMERILVNHEAVECKVSTASPKKVSLRIADSGIPISCMNLMLQSKDLETIEINGGVFLNAMSLKQDFKTFCDGMIKSQLVRLKLSGPKLMDPPYLSLMLQVVGSLFRLKELDLSQAGLGDQAIQFLSQSFSKDSLLELLDLESNNLTAKAIIFIADAIQNRLKHLQVLRLSHNKFADIGVQRLADVLKYHGSLISISLEDCGMEDLGLNFACNAAETIKNLESVRLGATHTSFFGHRSICSLISTHKQLR
jgi:hypothetical protein